MSDTANSDFLAEYEELPVFARQVGRHPRTVQRWMNKPDGLPFATLGNRTFIHIPTARTWMLSRMRRPNPRRGTNKLNKEIYAERRPD